MKTLSASRATLAFLAGLVLIGVGSSGSFAEALSSGGTSAGCLLQMPMLEASGKAVSEVGRCIVNGKAVPITLSYTYTQKDSAGNVCGAFHGTGPRFAIRIPGTYQLLVEYSMHPRTKIKGVLPVSRHAVLTPGSETTGCGTTNGSLPTVSQLCGAAVQEVAQPCGQIVPRPLTPPYSPYPSTYTGPFPTWTDKPTMKDLTISAPDYASPSGRCSERRQTTHPQAWLGSPVQTIYWVCADRINIAPSVHLFLTPDAVPGTTQSPASCSNEKLMNWGGQFRHFNIPANWSGRLDVFYLLYIFDKSGGLADTEYASNSFFLHGTANGCNDLTALTPP